MGSRRSLPGAIGTNSVQSRGRDVTADRFGCPHGQAVICLEPGEERASSLGGSMAAPAKAP